MVHIHIYGVQFAARAGNKIIAPGVRTVGFSLAFSLATAIFGGLTPAISTALVKLTGDKSSPGWWLMCAALCGLAATAMLFVRLSRGYIAAENKA